MYSFPELHSAEDRLKPIAVEEVNLCTQECTPKGQFPCDKTVFELCCLLMAENGWDDPADPFAAADLYILLRDEIRRQWTGRDRKILKYECVFFIFLDAEMRTK
ncbi:hypothetical protein F7725_000101, partial [Dissostichus mawsoni]